MADEIELTTERTTVKGTVPCQFRPFIRINRQIRVRAFGRYVRPRTVVLALAAAAAGVWWAVRLLGRAAR